MNKSVAQNPIMTKSNGGVKWASSNVGGIYLGSGSVPSGGINVSIADHIDFDNNTLYIDGNNNKIGIGVVPSYELSVDGKIDLNDGGKSVFIGTSAGVDDDATDNKNVGIGYEALFKNTTGDKNVALGFQSLYKNTSGSLNISIGESALLENTTGGYNVSLSPRSLSNNTTGSNNIGIGYDALNKNKESNDNIGIGRSALFANALGDDNIAIGSDAGTLITSGANNTAVSESIFIGSHTRANASSESNQIVIGHEAIGNGNNSVTLGNDQIVKTILKGKVGIGVGTDPPYELSVDGKMELNDGGKSVFIGTSAGVDDDATDNQNVGIGYKTLFANTIGSNNVAMGYESMYNNVQGGANVALGNQSLWSNTTGHRNVSVGHFTLPLNTSGSSAVSIGERALYSNTSGNENIGIGKRALYENGSGSKNIAIGTSAGEKISTGSSNTSVSNSIFIGKGTKANASGETNQIVIGTDAVGLGSNTVILGNDHIATTALKGNVGVGTTSPESTLEVNGSVGTSITTLTSTSSVTLDGTQHTVIINAAVASITLPAANTCSGRAYILVNRTNATRIVSAYHTLVGTTSNTIPANSSLTVQSDGTNWYAVK